MAVVLGACGPGPANQTNSAIPDDLLFVPTDAGLDLISAASGTVSSSITGGIASFDYSVLASTEPTADGTLVRRMDLAGHDLTRASVSGSVSARVISPSGELVAVTEPTPEGATPYVPGGRSSTRVVVVDSHGKEREYDLRGNFDPEAFSTNDRQLFMIEYIPAQAPNRYRVRRLNLATRRVLPIGRSKAAAPEQMQGTGRTQVYSPNGNELYTLYTQQREAGHEDEGIHGDHAFVHLLNLDGAWTHCIDLPDSFGSGAATASAMAVTPNGARLFVVGWTEGVVAVAAPQNLSLSREAEVNFGEPDDRTFAQATDERLYVGGASEVVVLDTDDFGETARWPMRAEITGLTLSDDGSRLYVSMSGEIDVLDASTGEMLNELETTDALGITHVEPPAE